MRMRAHHWSIINFFNNALGDEKLVNHGAFPFNHVDKGSDLLHQQNVCAETVRGGGTHGHRHAFPVVIVATLMSILDGAVQLGALEKVVQIGGQCAALSKANLRIAPLPRVTHPLQLLPFPLFPVGAGEGVGEEEECRFIHGQRPKYAHTQRDDVVSTVIYTRPLSTEYMKECIRSKSCSVSRSYC